VKKRSPVLLLGAGTGEATCGILYLAGYLRRHGVEAYVQLTDADETPAEIERSLERLVAQVKPRLVGISLKWFHHLERALRMARAFERIDGSIEVLVGGNSASWWWKELLEHEAIDFVALGDGEVPLLALARGDAEPPNVVSRGARKAPLDYVQSSKSDDVYYSHFKDIFLSQLDLHSFSGWVQPGKGCGENCLYCSGTRGMQKATFGRAVPFLRPRELVRRDHHEIAPHTWQLRYDFAGSSRALLEDAWQGVDWSRHSTTYFLWGVPPPGLAEALSANFQRVYMVVDIGCFSESQRLETLGKGLLKPCPTDRALLEMIDRCRAYPNLQLEISGIAGLPFASAKTLRQERALVERVLGLGCSIGYQRLEAQPGALVTEHPERFGMRSEAKSFAEFLEFFAGQEPGERNVPMVRYQDAKLEAAVQRTSDEVDALVWERAAARAHVHVDGRTRLRNAAAATEQFTLREWLGAHRAPAALGDAPVTVVRSIDGAGLACAPTVSKRRFADPELQQGDEAKALLSTLASFEKPQTIASARADAELVRQLVDARFLAKV
jgi:B12 binding domain